MASRRKARFKAAAVSLLVGLVAVSGVLSGGGGVATADVTSTAGAAFGLRVTGLLSLGPSPSVAGTGAPVAFGPLEEAVLGLALPGPQTCPEVPATNVVQACVIDAFTQGTVDPNPHLSRVHSQSTVAGVAIGSGLAPLLALGAVTASCNADGDGVNSAVDVVNLSSGVPITSGQIAPNTNILVDNLLQIRLHEIVEQQSAPEVNLIRINAARITVLGVGPLAGLEVTIGQVACAVAGPDVNQVTTTSGPTTSTSIIDGSTTVPPDGSTTVPPGVSTLPPGGDSSVTTIAGGAGGPTVLSGALARTGAFIKNGFVWAALALFLGGLALLGGRGEVQTWPPKRRSRPARGPKRTSTTWPKRRR